MRSTIVEQYPHEMAIQTRHVTVKHVPVDADNFAAGLLPICYRVKADSYDGWIRVGWALRNIDHHRLQSHGRRFHEVGQIYRRGMRGTGTTQRVWWTTLEGHRRWANWTIQSFPVSTHPIPDAETIMEALSGTHNDETDSCTVWQG
jgi:hypothetical protein